MSIYPGVSQIYTPRRPVHLRYPCISVSPPPPPASPVKLSGGGETQIFPPHRNLIILHYMRYLIVTQDYRLSSNSRTTRSSNLIGNTGSECASDSVDQKSPRDHIFISHGTLSWQSWKQDLVASSTLEAKYIACSEALREG
jgi:hypothetical protein